MSSYESAAALKNRAEEYFESVKGEKKGVATMSGLLYHLDLTPAEAAEMERTEEFKRTFELIRLKIAESRENGALPASLCAYLDGAAQSREELDFSGVDEFLV